MSMTPSFGAVGPEYWSYAAACTEAYLDDLDAARKPSNLPIRIEHQIQSFFDSAIDAGASKPQSMSASIANFQLALEVMLESGREPQQLPAVNEHLSGLKQCFERAVKHEHLESSELRELKDFFATLARRGHEALSAKYQRREFPEPSPLMT